MTKRENKIFAIVDDESNTFLQAFVACNEIQAKRNLEVAKMNLKKTCGEADFIDKLKVVEVVEFTFKEEEE